MMITDTATQWNVMNAALHLQQLIYGASKTGMAMCVHEYLEELPAGINRSAIINQVSERISATRLFHNFKGNCKIGICDEVPAFS